MQQVSEDPFLDARLLADHAGRQAALVKELADRQGGCLGNLRYAQGAPGLLHYKVDVVRVIPPEVSLYAADALHNMRSAMELAVWAAASYVKGAQQHKAKLKFPHAETREKYLQEVRKLDALLPDPAIAFLETGVDLHRADIPLYSVFPMNNSNKHRELIPVTFDIAALAFSWRGRDQQIIKTPNGLGTKLGTYDLGELPGPPCESMQSLVRIRFVNGGNLGPTVLTHMVEQTRAVVDGLAEACSPK